MSKQAQLIEYIIQDIIAFLIEEKGLTIPVAISYFYNSTVFEKLQDIETGLYLCSSSYVYEMFQSELENGRLVAEFTQLGA
ncbi:hypothetical protein AGMMS50276_05840 [Synergistales bacterium]|nr:hypothetical protein AGMMS50276_05840 [Synergistales bacterium]